jgi:TonB family protein
VHPKNLLAAMAIASTSCVVPSRLAAQDVTPAPLEWIEAKDSPDQLPVENRPLRPRFPDDLRNTPDPGYVFLEVFTNEKGKRLSLRPFSTLPAYEDAVVKVTRDWELKPGRRAGRPVNTFTRELVIFNPASASPQLATATPRLLAAELVRDPTRHAGKKEGWVPPEVVWATVSLDAAGGAIGVKEAPTGMGELLEKAVRTWRFAPARQAGVAVAADFRVPFIIVGAGQRESLGTGAMTPPRVKRQTRPEYPVELRRSGLRGDVVVDFVVDIEGRVTNAFVVRSLNPAFDEPALTAIHQWTFEPGRKGDTPVNTHMQVPIHFELQGRWAGGDTGLEVSGKVNQSDLPPELRYEVAPKPRGRVRPVYPYALVRDGVKGSATVKFLISETGKVGYAEVVQATQPEFGAAAVAMIEQWEFEPALRGGRPTQCVFSYTQEFSPDDTNLVPGVLDDLLALERKHPERIISAGKLDAPLKLSAAHPPSFPRSLYGRVAKGDAVIELLVDEKGRARLPRIVSASDPAFGWAALQAVETWRFDPPKSGGKSVVTRVRVPFEFSSPPLGQK